MEIGNYGRFFSMNIQEIMLTNSENHFSLRALGLSNLCLVV